MLAGDLRRDQRQRLWRRRVASEVGDRHAEEVRQRIGQTPLVQGADVDEDLTQPLSRVGLGLERGGDLGLRHDAP